MPYIIPEDKLPLELPEVAKFLPTETGEPPLGHATKWAWDTEKNEITDNTNIDNIKVFPIELNTMPGFAGSSAYYLRYMDPHNNSALVSEDAAGYWQCVDLYVGGTEHATGHLIYSRFWNKFLYDYGYSRSEEPFRKLVNQGMIQGRSNFVYRIKDTNKFVSLGLKDQYDVTPIHVDVNIVSGDILDTEAFKAWRPEYNNAEFILEDGKYVCGWAVEKMSKSMYNVVNPDMIVEKYGADTLRLYEMFLGPVEQSKPWDTNGIDGCHRFLKKFWGLFYDQKSGNATWDDCRTAQIGTQADKESVAGHREFQLQHVDIGVHDMRQRTVATEVPQQGTAPNDCRSHSPVRPAYSRRAVERTRRRWQRVRCRMARTRREISR
jgi:leucyl-tRNA synthetase